MDTQTETTKGKGKGKGKNAKPPRAPKGRKDNSGQEAVIVRDVIYEREEELVRLHSKAKDAGEDYSTAINKAAEDSGLNAAAVRKYIASKANDTFAADKKRVQQLALVFGADDDEKAEPVH